MLNQNTPVIQEEGRHTTKTVHLGGNGLAAYELESQQLKIDTQVRRQGVLMEELREMTMQLAL